jgi:hypothetical protein
LKARDAELDRLRSEKERDRPRSSSDKRRSLDDRPASQGSSKERRRSRHKHDGEEASSHGSRKRAGSGENGGAADSISKLDEELAQVRSLEPFLTKADGWSGSQVIQAIHDLNSEVLQFAASATDYCTFDHSPQPSTSKPTHTLQEVASRLGPQITRLLWTTDNSQDPTFVQLALQGCVSTCITQSLASFCMGLKPDDVLSQVYGHLHFSGTYNFNAL